MMMYQCRLRQGNSETVGFIEARAAYEGKMVKLPELGEGYWEVLSVGHCMTKAELSKKQSADRKQRQASDI